MNDHPPKVNAVEFGDARGRDPGVDRSRRSRTRMTHAEWLAEAARRFGPDSQAWRFVCPACGHVAAVADWQAAKAPENTVAFSCVGRYAGAKRGAFGEGPGPCDYAGGGLFQLNPVEVVMESGEVTTVFAFADAPREGGAA